MTNRPLPVGIEGVLYWPGALERADYPGILDAITLAEQQVPPAQARLPGGKLMSVAMTSMGQFGWWADAKGYRYVRQRPDAGSGWLPMPGILKDLWQRFLPGEAEPDSCLVNRYEPAARMALHQDQDEVDLTLPVLSISLGASARFRIGGLQRTAPTRSLILACGDVLALTGPARLLFHGIDRVLPATSGRVPDGVRYNLTLRVSGGGRP